MKDKPEEGKVYALTGASGTPSIAAGNSWAESEVDRAREQLSQARDKLEDAQQLLDNLQPISAKVDMDAIERIKKSFRNGERK